MFHDLTSCGRGPRPRPSRPGSGLRPSGPVFGLRPRSRGCCPRTPGRGSRPRTPGRTLGFLVGVGLALAGPSAVASIGLVASALAPGLPLSFPLPGPLLGPLPLAAQLPAAVEVRVTTGPDAAPLPGVWVEAEGTGIAGRTDSEGRVRLRGLPPGLHPVRASHLGYAPATATVEAATGRTAALHLVLLPAPLALEELRVEGEGARLPPGGVILRPEEAAPGTRSVADLVAGVTGVTVVRRGGPGSPATVSIRGSSADQVLVLVDGVPLNAPLTGEADLGALALGNVARVVVVPGAASARYGSGALGGVILVETRPATTGRATPRLSGALLAGSHGERGGLLVAGLRPGGGGAPRALPGAGLALPATELRLQMDRARGDFAHPLPPFRGGGSARRINADHEALRAHLAVEPGPLRLQAHAERMDRGAPGTVAQPSATGRQQQARVGGSVSWRSAPTAQGGWRLRSSGAAHRAEHRDPSPPFGGAYDTETRIREGGLELHHWREGPALTLQGGGSARVRGIRGTSLDPGTPERIREGGLWIEAGVRRDEAPLVLSLTGTLRADAHDLVRGLTWSPAVAGELRRGGTTASLRWARAFSPPSLADLFFQEGVLARANPELAPERVRGEWTAEVSRRMEAGPLRSRLSVAVWQGDVEGMILWFPDFRFVWSPNNIDVRRRGGSASLDLRLPAREAGIQASLERNAVTYAGPVLEGPVVYRAAWKGTLRLQGRVAGAELHAGLEAHGPRRTVPGSELNALDPFATAEAGASIPFRALGTEARLEITGRNLTNAQAAFLADYPLPGRWWTLGLRLGAP